MPAYRVRDFRDDELARAIQVWDQGRSADNASPVFSISEVMAAVPAGQPAVVAVVADELVGVAVAQAHGDRLLVCATNSVHSLDQAFLRPGRFDYVIPVGPPDPAARRAIWTRYLGPVADGVDVAQLVEASDMFTPADIEFAARKGAQAAFEREIMHRKGEVASTDDYLAAVADTRPTLTSQALTEFDDDIEHHARL